MGTVPFLIALQQNEHFLHQISRHFPPPFFASRWPTLFLRTKLYAGHWMDTVWFYFEDNFFVWTLVAFLQLAFVMTIAIGMLCGKGMNFCWNISEEQGLFVRNEVFSCVLCDARWCVWELKLGPDQESGWHKLRTWLNPDHLPTVWRLNESSLYTATHPIFYLRYDILKPPLGSECLGGPGW